MRNPHESELNPEFHEQERPSRLETTIYFIRHGEAEKLPGMHDDPAIDQKRHLTPEGRRQAEISGQAIAKDLANLQDGDLILFRASPYPRALETVNIARDQVLQAVPNEAVIAPMSRKPTKKEYGFSLDQYYAHGIAVHRRGSAKGLANEWVRHPEVFQADLTAAGTDKTADEILGERDRNFQKIAAKWERASTMLRKRWETNLKKAKLDPTETHPPRLIILEGSHGAIVPETWLKKAIQDHESRTGAEIPLDLNYGEYFKVHFSPNEKDNPVLTLHGQEVSVDQKYFEQPK